MGLVLALFVPAAASFAAAPVVFDTPKALLDYAYKPYATGDFQDDNEVLYTKKLNSLFAAALYGKDTAAGKESVIGGQLGYSRRLFKSKTSETLAEIGYDYSREDLITGPAVSIHSGRAFLGHKSTMTEGTDLDVSLEALTNFNEETLPTGKDGSALKDTRVNFKLGISAKIGLNLAVQTSIEARFDNRPGPLGVKNLAPGFVPEASALDTIMKASLIYTFVGAEQPKK